MEEMEEMEGHKQGEGELEISVDVEMPVEEEVTRRRCCSSWNLKKVFRNLVLLTLALGLLAGGTVFLWQSEKDGWLFDFFLWLKGLGKWGCLILCLVMVVSSFPFVVGYALLTLASGYLFGFMWGLVTVVAGSQLGFLSVYVIVNLFFKKRTEKVCSPLL